jgi:hypothetical protein
VEDRIGKEIDGCPLTKSAIFKLYPGSESERKWTIADMDKLVREQLRMGILDVSDWGITTEYFIPLPNSC